MKSRILLILAIILCACGTYKNAITVNDISENYKDVFILSQLICDHFRKTDERDINLNELILNNDTLKRISNNFMNVEKSYGGNIVVHYKFSDSRDISKIELSDKERGIMQKIKWTVKDSKKDFSGEIQFEYGERFYNIRKIIIY